MAKTRKISLTVNGEPHESTIEVRKRPKKNDSAEVYIGGEFIGVISRDDEDGDLSYNFDMAILDSDLE